MSEDDVDVVIRRAIGGDDGAVAWITDHAGTSRHAIVVVLDALWAGDAGRLERARSVAATSRDRQVVEIARAHLAGDHERVDALARDHLVDFPDSYVAAWLASGAPGLGPDA